MAGRYSNSFFEPILICIRGVVDIYPLIHGEKAIGKKTISTLISLDLPSDYVFDVNLFKSQASLILIDSIILYLFERNNF